MEDTDRVLAAEVPEPEGVASDVSLLRGFNATIPSAEKGRTRRRQMMRHADGPPLGLKRLGLNARGLLTDEQEEGQSEEDVVVVGGGAGAGKRGKRRARQSLGAGVVFGKDELMRQTEEIARDKENILVKRVCGCF
jgi:mitochondrial division protein 1